MSSYIYDLAGRKHVFIDWDMIEAGYGLAMGGEGAQSWEMPYGVQLAVHGPRIDGQPLVQPDRPWERSINFNSTLLEDDGRYRLYYNVWDPNKKTTDPAAFMLAYAESTDGATWVKPDIRTVSFDGSTDNNLVYALNVAPGHPIQDTIVFKDPSASPEQRYKLVYHAREKGIPYLFGAVSPDGLRWRPIPAPMLSDYHSDTLNVVRFDSDKGRYVGYFRGWTAYDVTRLHGRRTITYAETERFESWPRPEPLVVPDPQDGPDTDIYTNSYAPWPEADAHLMFPAYYHRSQDVRDVHMLTSRDELRWERITRTPVVPVGEPGGDWEAGAYAGAGLVSLRPGEWSLPMHPQAVSHNHNLFPQQLNSPRHRGFICAATWRQDGFTSLEAESHGAWTTMPLIFTGGRLEVNAWTRFGGEIRVELVDVSQETRGRGRLEGVPGRTFEDCDPISGDVLNGAVTWRGELDVSAWAGKTVRLRFRMSRARLHAIQFV